MNTLDPPQTEFLLDTALALATDAGRGYVGCLDRQFIDEASAAIGREPTSDELWQALRFHLFQGAMGIHYECRKRGASDAEADAVRDAFIEGAHAAMLCAEAGAN